MKLLVLISSLLLSAQLYACPDLTGQYFCPEEAEDHFYLGSRDLTLKFDAKKQIYEITNGTKMTSYTLDTWVPIPGSHTFKKATCTDSQVNLLDKFDWVSHNFLFSEEVDANLELSLNQNELKVKRFINNEIVIEIVCTKK